jgi:hypothetical protein
LITILFRCGAFIVWVYPQITQITQILKQGRGFGLWFWVFGWTAGFSLRKRPASADQKPKTKNQRPKLPNFVLKSA